MPYPYAFTIDPLLYDGLIDYLEEEFRNAIKHHDKEEYACACSGLLGDLKAQRCGATHSTSTSEYATCFECGKFGNTVELRSHICR